MFFSMIRILVTFIQTEANIQSNIFSQKFKKSVEDLQVYVESKLKLGKTRLLEGLERVFIGPRSLDRSDLWVKFSETE